MTRPSEDRHRGVEQFGHRDLEVMTSAEIVEAHRAGHFDALTAGDDRDADVPHSTGCSRPRLTRLTRLGDSSIASGDPHRYRCGGCGGTTPTEA
jgi:hypothetical protein